MSLGVTEESTHICQLINRSKLAELSFSICPLKPGKKAWGGGVQGYEDLLPLPQVSLIHMILSTNCKQA